MACSGGRVARSMRQPRRVWRCTADMACMLNPESFGTTSRPSTTWSASTLRVMWTITGVKQLPASGDADVHRWNLKRGDEDCFTDVKITGNALLKLDGMTERSLKAVDCNGRSEVERHLDDDAPPLVIEVGTEGDPRVTRRRDR
jgi:hypothetical protein